MSDEQAAVPVGSALTDDALRRAIDAVSDGVLVVDEAGTIVFLNPMVEELFGYPHDDLVGVCVDQLVKHAMQDTHTQLRFGYFRDPRTRLMGYGVDLYGRTRSGTEFPVEISLSPLEGRGRLLVIAIIRDLTQRRAAESQLKRAASELTLLNERERIARDLHDTVVQQLFAIALSLRASLSPTANPQAPERVRRAIADIDGTIREIRTTIFALHSRSPLGPSLRDDVVAVAHDAARGLGFEPSISFDGPVDGAATDQIREQLVSTLREALSNVVKHARAASVDIDVSMRNNTFVLYVADDGVGLVDSSAATGDGLTNMCSRAEALAGCCYVDSPSTGGTIVAWWIPIEDR